MGEIDYTDIRHCCQKMNENVLQKGYILKEDLQALVNVIKTTCEKAYEQGRSDCMNYDMSLIDGTIHQLDNLKKLSSDTEIVIETSHGTIGTKIGDALIYEGLKGEIIIDSK